jgi:tetratricopeptide (TPR) repeat protein
MYTLLISFAVSIAVTIGVYYFTYSYVLSVLAGILILFLINFFIGKHFLNKLKALFASVEKDLKNDRVDAAIKKLNDGYSLANWQFFVREQINAQIGLIYYTKKKFDEAKPYLEKAFSKNWMAMCMLATMYFKEGEHEKVRKTMEKAIKGAPKEGFVYSVYAYFLTQMGDKAKALEVLQKGTDKNPLDERLEANLVALQNNKKLKMQNYGPLWLQLHISKMPQGAKPYQALLYNQKIRRR